MDFLSRKESGVPLEGGTAGGNVAHSDQTLAVCGQLLEEGRDLKCQLLCRNEDDDSSDLVILCCRGDRLFTRSDLLLLFD